MKSLEKRSRRRETKLCLQLGAKGRERRRMGAVSMAGLFKSFRC